MKTESDRSTCQKDLGTNQLGLVVFDLRVSAFDATRARMGRVGAEVPVHMRMDMCIDMCRDMGIDMCTDMWIDMCMPMCIDMWIDMCIDMCMDSGTKARFENIDGGRNVLALVTLDRRPQHVLSCATHPRIKL